MDHPHIPKANPTSHQPTKRTFSHSAPIFSSSGKRLCLILRKMSRSLTPAQIISQLKNANEPHVTDLVNHVADTHERFEEDAGSKSLILGTFFDDGESFSINAICNFTASEFQEIWMTVADYVSKSWNIGRGRKSSMSGKDLLFILMYVLKHGQQWNLAPRLFKIPCQKLERHVTKFIQIINPILYEKFVENEEVRWTHA